MKVLLHSAVPFAFAHGGGQIQIERTREALLEIGVEAEFLRWWDAGQRGDLIHYFGRPPSGQIRLAQSRGVRYIFSDLALSSPAHRPAVARYAHRAAMSLAGRLLPGAFSQQLSTRTYALADAVIALTEWEAHVMRTLYGAAAAKVHVVPNGVEQVFTPPAAGTDKDRWLVCTASVIPLKQVVELAEAARRAEVPVWIIGQPFAEAEAYAQRLRALAQAAPQWVRYEGGIGDRGRLAEIYQKARGFVLLSTRESLSLSALEAAACGCPLLLSDLPWARSSFGDAVQYCGVSISEEARARALKAFYEAAPRLSAPPAPLRWPAVAQQLEKIYLQVLEGSSTSR